VLQDRWCVAAYYIYCVLQCNEKETSPLDYRVSVLHGVLQFCFGVLQCMWCAAVYLACCSVDVSWHVSIYICLHIYGALHHLASYSIHTITCLYIYGVLQRFCCVAVFCVCCSVDVS